MLAQLRALRDAHARLVARVHSFRVPIRSRAGRAAMGALYVSVPCALGWLSLQAVTAARDANLGAAGAITGDRPLLRAAAARAGTPVVTPVQRHQRLSPTGASEPLAPR